MSIYPPTGTLEIKNATLKIPVIDLQYTSNTAKIEANSNVVTEFSRSKKLIKYPRVAMTQNDESATSGYVADQTNTASHGNADAYAYRLFDNTSGAYQSGSAYSSGIPTSSAPTTTASDGSTHQGVAITLDLVTKIRLDHAVFTSHANYGRTPVDGSFLGSNDSSTWDVIGTFAGLSTSADNQKHTINITGSSQKLAYRYIRFVITKTHDSSVFNGNSLLEFRELEYYGIPEYDPEAHGTDVVVKSLPNVPNTDWLEVYYDAKGLADGAVTAIDDLTPSGTNDGTATNVTVSDGAFVFNGTSSLLESSTTITNSTGDIPHTFSLWVKPSDGDLDDTGNHYLIAYGTELNTGKWSGISISNKRFASVIHASVVRFGPEIRVGEWYHIVLNYKSGGIHNSDRFDFFINGSQINTSALSTAGSQAGSATLNLSSPAKLVLGGLFNGSERSSSIIANARLFNRALTSDEIWQLYAYQKEYFGHGDLGMTLKAGRLGIGTSEPRAALDVRGNILGGSPAAFSVAYNPTSLSGNQTIIWNLVYHNIGGGYNSSSGLFTAPVSGYYHFTVWGMTSGSTSGVIEFQFRKNGSTVQQRPYGQAGSNYGNATGTIIEYLSVGDTMSIFLTNSATMYASSAQSYNGFSGFYLSN
jgi:hypothetical protein